MKYRTVAENQEYILTIQLDDSYLRDGKTAYPIRIDPTIEIGNNASTNGIHDVTLNSNSGSDHTSTALFVGKRSNYGKSRILMKFPMLNLATVHSSRNVLDAVVELRDVMCEAEAVKVNCHMFEGNLWNQTTVTWSSAKADKYSSLLSAKTISYSNGVNLATPFRYEFNVKNAVKRWVDGSFNQNLGLMFKASDSTENGSTAKYKTFASFNNSSYKPSITVQYTTVISRNEYFSKYDPDKYNYDGDPENINVNVPNQLYVCRANCYGYALSVIYNGVLEMDGYVSYEDNQWYKQQPGDFALEADEHDVVYFEDIIVNNNPEATWKNVENNMEYDQSLLGFTVTKYAPTSGTLAQFGESSRLIALATGNADYHFYVQHSDGTWSHKQGSLNVSNLSISSGRILTNENIMSLANEGEYSGGELKFYLITKNAIVDYAHDHRPGSGQIALFYKELAGDYLETAVSISTGVNYGRIDFAEDNDCFYISVSSSREYNINIDEYFRLNDEHRTNSNIRCILYNNEGTPLGNCTSLGTSTLSVNLYPGTRYFLKVINLNKVYTGYKLTIS